MRDMNSQLKPNSRKRQDRVCVSSQRFLISILVVFILISCTSKNNINYQQTLIGTWNTTDFRDANGTNMTNNKAVVWSFTGSQVRYFENGVELLGHPFSYEWLNSNTIKMTDSVAGIRTWELKFVDENTLNVTDTPDNYKRSLVRIADIE